MSENKYKILLRFSGLCESKIFFIRIPKSGKVLTNAKCILFDPILQQVKELEIHELEKKFNDKYIYTNIKSTRVKKEIFLSPLSPFASNAIPYVWYVFVVTLYLKVHNWLYKIRLLIFLISQFFGSIHKKLSIEFYKFNSYGNKAYYCV